MQHCGPGNRLFWVQILPLWYTLGEESEASKSGASPQNEAVPLAQWGTGKD